MPTAIDISVEETLGLLDGPYRAVADGVARGDYTFWLGSGISRGRVIGLDGVLARLIEFLRCKVTGATDCIYRAALQEILALASPTATDQSQIDLAAPAATWPCLPSLVSRLWDRYSQVLSVEIPGHSLDYLLWEGLAFPTTFSTQHPDVEHLSLAMLALEGAVSKMATTNWDGLIEAAFAELGCTPTAYTATVTGQDLRGPATTASLFKFHGCAIRAIEDEATYRPLLVATKSQITAWFTRATFNVVRDQLLATIEVSRSLVIGLSAQDENIKNLFSSASQAAAWPWNDAETPIVFSAETLGADHIDVLKLAYGGEYEPNREAIREAARLQAYAKALLPALLLYVLSRKLCAFADDATASKFDDPSRAAVRAGIDHVRDLVAAAGEADRMALIEGIAQCVSRSRHQLLNGSSEDGSLAYFPIDRRPAHQVIGDPAMQITGQREAAVAIGLIGLMADSQAWKLHLDDLNSHRSGALRITSDVATARVFFAANDLLISSLLECGAFSEDEDDAVIVCAGRIQRRQQRTPSATRRTGKAGARYVAMTTMLAESSTINDVRQRFRDEIAI